MKKCYLNIFLLFFGTLSVPFVQAGGTYQEPADFINQVFDNAAPKPEVLWLNEELKKQVADILDHKYRGLRVRYWQQGKKSAWILEETGIEKLITTGIVINNRQIEQVKVLVFRESRGWEVRHDFFTDQFKQSALKDNHRLDNELERADDRDQHHYRPEPLEAQEYTWNALNAAYRAGKGQMIPNRFFWSAES